MQKLTAEFARLRSDLETTRRQLAKRSEKLRRKTGSVYAPAEMTIH